MPHNLKTEKCPNIYGGECKCVEPVHHDHVCARSCPDVAAKLTATLAAMRKDGQGVTQDQEATIRRGLGLS